MGLSDNGPYISYVISDGCFKFRRDDIQFGPRLGGYSPITKDLTRSSRRDAGLVCRDGRVAGSHSRIPLLPEHHQLFIENYPMTTEQLAALATKAKPELLIVPAVVPLGTIFASLFLRRRFSRYPLNSCPLLAALQTPMAGTQKNWETPELVPKLALRYTRLRD